MKMNIKSILALTLAVLLCLGCVGCAADNGGMV